MHGRGWHGGLSGRAGWVDVGDGGGGGDAVARAGRVDAVGGAYEFGSVDADDGCAWELWDGECRDADGVVGVGESDAVIELGRCPVGACDRGCRGGGGDLGCPGLIVTGVGGTRGEGAEKVRLRARRKLPVVPLCVCCMWLVRSAWFLARDGHKWHRLGEVESLWTDLGHDEAVQYGSTQDRPHWCATVSSRVSVFNLGSTVDMTRKGI